MSFKRKDNKMIFFNKIMRESEKKREQRAAASSESIVPPEDKKAEAAKEENPGTKVAGNKDVGSRSEASPRDRTEETHKKRRHFLFFKRTQDRWIRANVLKRCTANFKTPVGMQYSYQKHGAKTRRKGRHNKVTSWLSRGSLPTNTELRSCWTDDGKIVSTGYNALASVWLQCQSQSTNIW